MPKDREQTRANILRALGRLLAHSGFREVGVNAVAREAGVDKVLIYRYFGGLPELIHAFAEDQAYWPVLADIAGESGKSHTEANDPARAKQMLLAFGHALRKRPLTQEIMRWELLERNALTDALARHREEQGEKLFQSLDKLTGIDLRAIGSLLAAGLTYLTLRAKTVDLYNGLQLNSEKDWARIEEAVSFLVDAAIRMSETAGSDRK